MASSTAPTATAGKNNHGTVFALDLNGDHFNVLSAFPDTAGGSTPESGLLQARDGNFYGTTNAGGANGFGVFYQVTPDGTLTYLQSFNNGDPGANPVGSLFEGIDGALYGTAQYGGVDNFGTIFRATIPDSTNTSGTLGDAGRDHRRDSRAIIPRATSSRPPTAISTAPRIPAARLTTARSSS